MGAVIPKLMSMSLTATWMALAVIILRQLLRKAPKWIMGILWSFVALRLICPFSVESVFSLIPSIEAAPQNSLISDAQSNGGFSLVSQVVDRIALGGLPSSAANGVFNSRVVEFTAVVWLTGMLAMLGYAVISYRMIVGRVKEAVPESDKVRLSDRIPTPFILGIFRPKIYLPTNILGADKAYALMHERAHLKRGDQIWKPLGFALLAVYWFNPVLWVSYVLLCRDIESACDEKVVKQMGEEIKKPYSEALINCSVSRKMLTACPLSFGESGVKERVKNVLNYKKPALWVIIVAVVICGITAVCLLTNPQISQKTVLSSDDALQYRVSELLCCDLRFSFAETENNAPQYYINNGSLMWNRTDDGQAAKNSWTKIGDLESFNLNHSEFNKLLGDADWTNDEYEGLFDEITAAEKTENEYNGIKQFFYILKLKDSSLVLCRGFEFDDGTPYIRWVQKLEQVTSESK